MRRRTLWRVLALISLSAAGTMAFLAIVAVSLAQAPAAGAAGVCAAAFFVPGLFFLNYARRLYLRDVALAHAAEVADAKGVTDAAAMAAELDVPARDAELILRKAIAEGLLVGTLEAGGRFVSASAPRCPACRRPLAKDARTGACPQCGAPLAGG